MSEICLTRCSGYLNSQLPSMVRDASNSRCTDDNEQKKADEID